VIKKHVYVMYSINRKQFFFTKSYGISKEELNQLQGEDWYPITFTIPHFTQPRYYLKDGLVDTNKKIMSVYFQNAKMIKPPKKA
jgi:hypothetical protein